MKIKKLLIMLPIVLYVVKNLGTLIRLKKRQRNTKKFVNIAILQVGIEVVLIASAIQTIVINVLKSLCFFITWKIMMDTYNTECREIK